MGMLLRWLQQQELANEHMTQDNENILKKKFV
jgi:hypothetical protein